MSYQTLIRTVRDGEAVRGGVTNRPTLELKGNIDHLKSLLDTISAGSTVIDRAKNMSSAVAVGRPVYYNTTNHRYEPALASVAVDAATGVLSLAESAKVRGVCITKNSSENGDVLLFGMYIVDMSLAIDDTVVPGDYYLSPMQAGKLVRQEPGVSVPVLTVMESATTSTWLIYVNPLPRALLDGHKHHKFSLQCVPAGESVLADSRWSVTADTDIEGWLPADDPSFGGLAPLGAQFGYNIAASSFSALWPPLPVESAVLLWNRGEDFAVLGTLVPTGADELVVIDRNGIWWMSNCFGDVPWPTVPDSISEGVSEVCECPRALQSSMTLWFSLPLFYSLQTAVLSLTVKDGSPLTITCAGTDDTAGTGHLVIGLQLALTVQTEDTAGYTALKGLTDAGTFIKGPMVESVVAGSDNVTLTGDVTNEDGSVQGKVSIFVDNDLTNTELQVDTVRLDGVTDEYYEEVMGLGFPAGRQAAYRGRISVPAKQTLPEGTVLKLRLQLLGRTTGTVPDDVFSLTYRVLSRDSALLTAAALPTADSASSIDAGITLASSNQVFTAESAAISVVAGDTVFFTLQRLSTDAYSGELHVIRQAGVLSISQ